MNELPPAVAAQLDRAHPARHELHPPGQHAPHTDALASATKVNALLTTWRMWRSGELGDGLRDRRFCLCGCNLVQ